MNTRLQYKNIIFLDIDGVLNCQVWYSQLKTQRDIDPWRVSLLNDLCKETNSAVVISSSWRLSGLEYCKTALRIAGATFDIIDKTPFTGYARGTEIDKWLYDNCKELFGIEQHMFYRYAIVDDDSDMLLNQGPHLFKVDRYAGLTPNTIYEIKRFLIYNVGNNV